MTLNQLYAHNAWFARSAKDLQKTFSAATEVVRIKLSTEFLGLISFIDVIISIYDYMPIAEQFFQTKKLKCSEGNFFPEKCANFHIHRYQMWSEFFICKIFIKIWEFHVWCRIDKSQDFFNLNFPPITLTSPPAMENDSFISKQKIRVCLFLIWKRRKKFTSENWKLRMRWIRLMSSLARSYLDVLISMNLLEINAK